MKNQKMIAMNVNWKINLDVNPETFEEWEREWIENHPSVQEPKRHSDFYDEVIREISSHFWLTEFEHYDTDDPLYYTSYDGKIIEQYWKAESEDVIVLDFENNIFKHRYTITFIPKTLKGLYMISSYLLSIQEKQWFMEINTDDLFKTAP
ncbi:hypothetical protein [Virgibacillus halodenitrificans]|uniref:hypothetical protein n=1 Tax=Virgibacillus halodenitrificans TaxID=1482 RepID=UPI000EF509BF|nr:hypothetical protein [Virgibacillus halodenitrificans]